MPFGLGVADWDVLLTDDQLALFFRQLEIINMSGTTVLAGPGRPFQGRRARGLRHGVTRVRGRASFLRLQAPAEPAWHWVLHLRRGGHPRGLQLRPLPGNACSPSRVPTPSSGTICSLGTP